MSDCEEMDDTDFIVKCAEKVGELCKGTGEHGFKGSGKFKQNSRATGTEAQFSEYRVAISERGEL
jgi:hypothetical protein